MNSDFIDKIKEVEDELNKIKEIVGKKENKLSSVGKYLTHYAVVRSSGRIERLFKELLEYKLSNDCSSSHTRIRNFISKEILDSSCNPTTGRIEEYLSRFDPNWKEDFDIKIKDHMRNNVPLNIKSDLNSLVQLRNDISHGGACNTSIDTIIKYYSSSSIILHILDDILCNG